ncbi:glutamyl-tRNA [Caballeronia arvi]|uniref:Glutamyl-tRNA n=2 Tax=Caballeronia arvi TaxID=1777135 RepID=A0A158KJ58_9BURK|nr:glutamyl-tRNA [Caballeronia arvi]
MKVTGLIYQKIQLRRLAYKGRLEAMFQRVDLLLTPVGGTADTTAARMLRFGEEPELISSMLRYTCPFDMSGSPTITMPAGFNAAGAPMAIQLVGRHFDEQLLVQVGDAYQQATAWHKAHPVL